MGPPRLPHAVVQGPRARTGPRRPRPLPAWHVANPRGWSAPRRSSDAVVELDDGEQVQLTGYADRLELDADGHVVVVDLKTGRTKPSRQGRSSATSSSALYQYAVDHGAVDELAREATASAAAPSSSSSGCSTADRAVVQQQPAQPDDGPDRDRAARRGWPPAVAAARRGVPGGRRPALPRLHFVPICPIKGAGSVTSQ